MIKVNRKNLKVRQDEDRNSHPAGTVWTVPPCFCLPRDAAKNLTPAPGFLLLGAGRLCGLKKGNKVEFATKTGKVVVGYIQRVNKKTVSVQPLDDLNGRYWRVSPGLCKVVS